MAERHFCQASLEYVFLLQEVQERKKFEFVETVKIEFLIEEKIIFFSTKLIYFFFFSYWVLCLDG